jgi:hypothetical protein
VTGFNTIHAGLSTESVDIPDAGLQAKGIELHGSAAYSRTYPNRCTSPYQSPKDRHRMSPRKKTRQRILWTPAHEKQLRRLSGRAPVARIARELRRSEAAVRYKAHTLSVSLALKR